MPSLTLEDGKSWARYSLFSQKNRPLGQADVPVVIMHKTLVLLVLETRVATI